MKSISTKKLLTCSVISMVVGLGLVYLNYYQMIRTPSIYHINEIRFYNTVVWPIGTILFLLGAMVSLFTLTRIILGKIKTHSR